ncbi:MAG: histidine triad nucleotide-binding protein [Candidatus Sumerlaeaceae bacterium]
MPAGESATDCLFCKFVACQIPVEKLYDDPDSMAFRDINPQAPHHILIIPKSHIATLNDLSPADAEVVGKLHLVAAQLARENGIAESGYRTVFNCNRDAGQAVYHIHLHLLGGRELGWPPG